MSKIAIVYWSGTGNTETMANCIADGARAAGAEVELMGPAEFSASRFSEFGAVAFGCPAMGSEVLEEEDFEPMFSGLEGSLGGKKIALFGSYGWGDGQWMRDWFARCEDANASLLQDEGLIANETPDDDVQEACRQLGRKLAAC
nr:flavodoxin [uncultured Oscillibacter sp.]